LALPPGFFVSADFKGVIDWEKEMEGGEGVERLLERVGTEGRVVTNKHKTL
jgi:hypothetical protein